MKINNFFLQETQIKILLGLETEKYNGSDFQMSIKIGCNYYAYSKAIKNYERMGLVKIERTGRENIVSLTEKGKQIAENLKLLNEQI